MVAMRIVDIQMLEQSLKCLFPRSTRSVSNQVELQHSFYKLENCIFIILTSVTPYTVFSFILIHP